MSLVHPEVVLGWCDNITAAPSSLPPNIVLNIDVTSSMVKATNETLFHSASLFIIFHGVSWERAGRELEQTGSELERVQKIFHFGRVFGPQRPIHTIKLQ